MSNWFGFSELSGYKTAGKVLLIPIESIAPNPAQPRKFYSRSELEELAESIQANGLLQPVTVRRIKNKDKPFELVAGHRRLMAVTSLGREQIEAIIQEISDADSAVLAVVENMQRKQLTYFEEAEAISSLCKTWNISQQEVAKRLGKTQSTIANKLRLLRIPDELRSYLVKSGLTERHARALLKLEGNPEKLRQAAEAIVERGLNVQQSETYIEKLCEPEKDKITRIVLLRDYRLFVNTIKKAVDTMNLAGMRVNTQQTEEAEYIEYRIRIPKAEAYRKKEQKIKA